MGAGRNKAQYEETVRQMANQSNIALKRSDFEREFQTLKENRLKRKDKYDEIQAKCLKTITAKIGPALLMRVNELILVNRWTRSQVYHDLNKDLAGTSGGTQRSHLQHPTELWLEW